MNLSELIKKENWTKARICTVIKYAFTLVLIMLSFTTTRSIRAVVLGFTEALLVFVCFDFLEARHKAFSWVNSIFILILNVQYLIQFFGGSFLTLVMLQNINSIQDLGGKAFAYGIGALFVLICSFLPIGSFLGAKKKLSAALIGGAVILEILVLVVAGTDYSPYRAVYGIYEQWNIQLSLYGHESSEDEDVLAAFYNGGILEEAQVSESEEVEADTDETITGASTEVSDEDSNQKEVVDIFAHEETETKVSYSCNISHPNILLIFTEGLSENIVTDSRNIMPNVANMQNNSLNFTNYYNHTFATYRGLIGQLYSGYQREDTEKNYLISLQEILKDQGYWTTMINTEPQNETFAAYLNSLNFDEVITDFGLCDGNIFSFSDKTAYEYLLAQAELLNQTKGQPFLLTIYTFGTHASLDSTDEIFEDGSERVLNRFYNLDYQFGQFMEAFKASELANNTIVVFTADHAAYADQDFLSAFPEYTRRCSDVDEIPFFIYSVGGPMAQVSAEGRNSLDFAPTLLQYLNIDAPNYFLGTSLFREKKKGFSLDTYFYDPTYMVYTGNDKIENPNAATQELILDALRRYFSVSTVPRE